MMGRPISVAIFCAGVSSSALWRDDGWYCERCGARVKVVW